MHIVTPCFVLMLAACSMHGASVTVPINYYFDIPSMRPLGNVYLGMSASDLIHARPGVVAAPYVGFEEEIAGDSVQYHFEAGSPRSDEEGIRLRFIPPDASAHLLATDAWERVAEPRRADLIWKERVKQVARHGDPTCFSYRHGETVRAVIASVGNITVGAVEYPARSYPSATGIVRYPGTVRTFVTSDVTRFVPSGAQRTPFPCQ